MPSIWFIDLNPIQMADFRLKIQIQLGLGGLFYLGTVAALILMIITL